MWIKRLELLTPSLPAQLEYYQHVLQLPAQIQTDSLIIQTGRTELIFKQADSSHGTINRMQQALRLTVHTSCKSVRSACPPGM
jgi:hypothetical protein